ncbi:MAG: hypothetical protein SF053_07580 [Bacteroidia bacterium]|nr:hypothetical protein [Bacteroidia bacterium]
MDLIKELDTLEDLYYGEWEEDKPTLINALIDLHINLAADSDTFNRFLMQTAERFGGAYIPYLFWDKLAAFLQNPYERTWLQELINKFVFSAFDDEEQHMMKPMLVVYIARERRFELDKIHALYLEKSHPQVQEYFTKLIQFVDRNQKATEMYCDKFDLLKDMMPNFDLLNLPITQLRDKLKEIL